MNLCKTIRLASAALAVVVALTVCYPLGALAADAKLIAFTDMEGIIKKNNVGVKIAESAVIKAKEKTEEYTDPHGALYNQISMVYMGWDAQKAMAEANGVSTLGIDIFYQSQLDQINRQLDSLGQTNEALADAVTNAENARDKAVSGQLSAAKTLFVTAHTIDRGVDSAKNGLKILASQIERAKKLVDAGLAPASTLEQFNLKADGINAQIDSLKRQREGIIIKLKSTLGLALTDNIDVGSLPAYDFAAIDKIIYRTDLRECLKNNLDVKQKERTYKEIDAGNRSPTTNDINIARLSLEQAKLAAEVNFKAAYDEMVSAWNQLKEDRKSLLDAKDKLAKAETKLSVGLIAASLVKNQRDAISTSEYAIKSSEVSLALKCQNYENLKQGN